MRQDLEALRAQGLVSRRTLYVGPAKQKVTLLALTKAGLAEGALASRKPAALCRICEVPRDAP
jgi:hypothetical protein